MLFLLAYHIVFTGYAWGVWGLLACSLLYPPPISFCPTLTLTLAFPIVIVVGSQLGSPVGLGDFEVNSGCFSLLLVGTCWWLVYLLPLLGQQALLSSLLQLGLPMMHIAKDIWFTHYLDTAKSVECL